MRPIRPSGVHAATTISPPGRATAHELRALRRCWRGANITPKHERDAVEGVDQRTGSSSASPSTKLDLDARRRAARCALPPRAASGVRSRPVTAAPARAAGIATLPRAGRDVEQLDARARARALGERTRATAHDPLRDLGVVARGPHRLLAFLEAAPRRCSSLPPAQSSSAPRGHALCEVALADRCPSARRPPRARSSSSQRSARGGALVFGARALQRHASRVLSPIARIAATSSALERASRAASAASSARLSSIGRASGAALLDQRGATQRTAGCARFHGQASCSIVRPWRSAYGRISSSFSRPASHPALGAELAVVVARRTRGPGARRRGTGRRSRRRA